MKLNWTIKLTPHLGDYLEKIHTHRVGRVFRWDPIAALERQGLGARSLFYTAPLNRGLPPTLGTMMNQQINLKKSSSYDDNHILGLSWSTIENKNDQELLLITSHRIIMTLHLKEEIVLLEQALFQLTISLLTVICFQTTIKVIFISAPHSVMIESELSTCP